MKTNEFCAKLVFGATHRRLRDAVEILSLPRSLAAEPAPSPKVAKTAGDIVVEVDGALVHVRARPGFDALRDVLAALRKTRGC